MVSSKKTLSWFWCWVPVPHWQTTTSAINGLGMGVAATAVLVFSNLLISLLKSVIPDKVRIPCYIVVIAGLVTVVQMLVQAYAIDLYNALGVFLPMFVCKLHSFSAVLRCSPVRTALSTRPWTAWAWVWASH